MSARIPNPPKPPVTNSRNALRSAQDDANDPLRRRSSFKVISASSGFITSMMNVAAASSKGLTVCVATNLMLGLGLDEVAVPPHERRDPAALGADTRELALGPSF
ncbi:hypothetical protein CGRA01v4_07812 [Colletotrichum graminicola]|nr:hypothetical protein CGRA01v4_07812 [Colletotrichum graminicola]